MKTNRLLSVLFLLLISVTTIARDNISRDEALNIIKENNYLDKLYKRFVFNNAETMEKYNDIYRVAKKYLEEKG